MNILDRYLYRTVLVYTAMAMAVLLTLGALFLFISQQSDIGVGSYSAGDAFLFTLLNLPQQAFELLPIGALIGALMGLGNLASGSELKVRPTRSWTVCSARVERVTPGPTSNRIEGVDAVSVLTPSAKRTGSRACRAQ